MSACGILGNSDPGESYARTDRVDVFLSAEEIPREHRKIGETELAVEPGDSLGHIQYEAQREGRRRGAHALVIEDQALDAPWRGSALAEPRSVIAHFYRYGSAQAEAVPIIEPEIDPATTELEENAMTADRAPAKEIKPRWQWWWNRDKTDDTVASIAEPEVEPEVKRIDPTGTAVFTGDVEKLEKLGLPKPDQTILED